jgi:hypothetical protein
MITYAFSVFYALLQLASLCIYHVDNVLHLSLPIVCRDWVSVCSGLRKKYDPEYGTIAT